MGIGDRLWDALTRQVAWKKQSGFREFLSPEFISFHPGSLATPDHMPDDAALIDVVLEWAPNETARNSILVDNRARLYGS